MSALLFLIDTHIVNQHLRLIAIGFVEGRDAAYIRDTREVASNSQVEKHIEFFVEVTVHIPARIVVVDIMTCLRDVE